MAASLSLVDSIKGDVARALTRLSEHPFVREALAGRLSREQTVRWVLCAGRDSRAFLDLLEGAVCWMEDPAVESILRGNLEDELGNGDPDDAHFRHYVHLLDRIGIARSRFDAYREGPGITLALETAAAVARTRDAALVFGYLIINEAMTPVAFRAAKASVGRHFPRVPASFFDMHISVDEWHVNELYRALACLCENHADVAALRYGIDLGERGMAALLDEAFGIYEHSAATGELIASS